jgi:hypothetical protein
MSDTSGGGDRGAAPAPGWWRADDGNWYPPAGGAPTSATPPTQAWTPPPPPAGLAGPTAAYGPPPGPAPGYGYGYGYGPPAPVTNGLAIAALVCGILWLYWIGSILALVFGYVAKSQIDRSGGAQGGRGMAIAGIVLGWVGVAALIFFFIVFVLFLNEVDRLEDFDDNGQFGALLGLVRR